MVHTGAERVLDFANDAAFLCVRHGQLVVRREGHEDVTTPMAELAAVVLANARVTCTQSVLAGLMGAGAAVLVCGEDMTPNGMMLPLAGHTAQTQRMIAQARASEPRKKRVWQQIVRAKVRAQASVLVLRHGDDAGLGALAERVRSGDPGNIEAQAAQRYWVRLFGDGDFRRRRDAADQNRLLNYGYAVMRAAVGRAVCAAGLHPSLGVHHRGRNNPFCLADDLMEPWRTLVDAEVAEIVGETGGDIALDGSVKQRLIGLLHERLEHEGERRTVLEWIGRSASSLGVAFGTEQPVDEIRLFFPRGLLEA